MKSNTNLVLQHLLWRGLYFFSILILNILIAHFFAAEKSGEIFFIVNNLALVLLIAGLSLESGAIYYISAGTLSAAQMGRFCLIWAISASILATTGWGMVLYFSHSTYLTGHFLLTSFLFILGVLLSTYFTALFYAKKEFRLPNKILFIVNGLLVILLIVGKDQSVIRTYFIEIYFSFFSLQGIMLFIFFFKNQSIRKVSWIPAIPVLRKLFQYSSMALLANGIYFLVNRIDYWFVQYYCSADDLGNYIQASKLAQMLFVVPSILAATFFPIFSSGVKSAKTIQLTAVMRVLFLFNGIICIVILCTGWYFIPLIFGNSFNSMYLLFILLIPGILCVTLNYPIAAWFSSEKRIGINIRGSLFALIVICAGDLTLIPYYGVMAASVVSSAGFICYYFYNIHMFRKGSPEPLKGFILIRKSDIRQIIQTLRNKLSNAAPENRIV